jgi:hypothetical protein
MKKEQERHADLQSPTDASEVQPKEALQVDLKEAAIAITDYADAGRTYPFTTW